MGKNSFRTPLKVEVMEGGKTFKLTYPFTYVWRWGKLRVKIRVPIGAVTDFASIPRGARLIIPKLGKHTKASVIHDELYRNHTVELAHQAGTTFLILPKGLTVYHVGDVIKGVVTRELADIIFRDGMSDLSVVKWKYTAMFWAVRLFGWFAWRKRA